MTLQQIINSRLGVALALIIGRSTPPGLGHGLASFIADRLAGRKQTSLVRAVRSNQWVVAGGQLSCTELDLATRAVFRHVGRCLYDAYHTLGNPGAVMNAAEFSPEFEAHLERIRCGNGGALFVIPHLSNFDLMGRALAHRGIRIQVLSQPDPPGGYRMQNQVRQRAGLEMTPISFSSLRRALENLKSGGAVLTGVDRPDPESRDRPVFFGRQAALPTGYVRLALKAGLPITPIAVQMQPGGRYRLQAGEPVAMKTFTDPVREVVYNAEAVLRVMEVWIRETPEQWAMFYPVWPEAINEIT